jgi:hypothetical protein
MAGMVGTAITPLPNQESKTMSTTITLTRNVNGRSVQPLSAPSVSPTAETKKRGRPAKTPPTTSAPMVTREALLASLDGAIAGLLTARQSVVGAIKTMAKSGLWNTEELVKAVRAAYVARGCSPQAASAALIAAGIRQKAERKEGNKGGRKGNSSTDGGPSIPADPAEFAKLLIGAMGKEVAIRYLAASYAAATLG